jgi:protein ImuA
MPPSAGPHRPDPALLEELRARIRRIERHAPNGGNEEAGVLTLGAPEIDGVLPWGGLPRAALHEIIGERGAASGFCAGLLARLAGDTGTVLWCRREPGLHAPGLDVFGLDPKRLVVVRGHNRNDIPWAMEEGLGSAALAAVLGETDGIAVIPRRRLQLAAEKGGVTALLLRTTGDRMASGPALTRWRVDAAPGGFDAPRWRVDLLRCRGGNPAAWIVEWHDGKTGGFTVVAELRHRSVESATADEIRRTG